MNQRNLRENWSRKEDLHVSEHVPGSLARLQQDTVSRAIAGVMRQLDSPAKPTQEWFTHYVFLYGQKHSPHAENTPPSHAKRAPYTPCKKTT